ncbi:MAG: acetyl-CoA carboxylase biotin carboxyl carrier protein [Rhodospirillaceae bacterium]|nr:acetyl-CoA carboxylase biotin carboxyl carrier protein [Rhodospirillaceae bacterium]
MSKVIDSESVRRLAELLNEAGLSEIEYDTGTIRIRVARDHGGAVSYAPPPAAAPPAPNASSPTVEVAGADVAANHPGAITSPMVGTVYLAPEPGAASFINVGDTISKGQTLMIVEAMKTFNEIKAPNSGTVKQIVIENGMPVEFGDVLAIID